MVNRLSGFKAAREASLGIITEMKYDQTHFQAHFRPFVEPKEKKDLIHLANAALHAAVSTVVERGDGLKHFVLPAGFLAHSSGLMSRIVEGLQSKKTVLINSITYPVEGPEIVTHVLVIKPDGHVIMTSAIPNQKISSKALAEAGEIAPHIKLEKVSAGTISLGRTVEGAFVKVGLGPKVFSKKAE